MTSPLHNSVTTAIDMAMRPESSANAFEISLSILFTQYDPKDVISAAVAYIGSYSIPRSMKDRAIGMLVYLLVKSDEQMELLVEALESKEAILGT